MRLLLSVALFFVCSLADIVTAEDQSAVLLNTDSTQEYLELYSLLAEAVATVELNYATPVDRKQLFESAIAGMLKDLDPYSAYLTKEKLQKLRSGTQGQSEESENFGLVFAIREEQLLVLTVLPNSAAETAGVRPGDSILTIANTPASKLSLPQAEEVLHSGSQQHVVIEIESPAGGKSRIVQLVKAKRSSSSVTGVTRIQGSWSYLVRTQPRIAYVAVRSFSATTAADLEHAIVSASAEKALDGMVLDLRFNAGGLLNAAVEVADLFLNQGRIVSTSGRSTKSKVWDATSGAPFGDLPVAVLINRFSASSAEVVAAALQDNRRATVVGERSWGKGSVQNVFELAAGSGIKLTTASYQRPSGANIHRFPADGSKQVWGVAPEPQWALALSAEEAQSLIAHRAAIANQKTPTAPVVDRQLDLAVTALLEEL